MRFERFFGPWGEEWGKVDISSQWRRMHREVALGAKFVVYHSGTTYGDKRQKISYTLAIAIGSYSINLTYLRKKGER